MACSIKQDESGKVTEISYKGTASKLYPQLKKILPRDAAFQWAVTRTKLFKDWYGSEDEPVLLDNAEMYYYQNSKGDIKLVQMKGEFAYEKTAKRKLDSDIEFEDKVYEEALEIIGDNPLYNMDEKAWALRRTVIQEFRKRRKAAIQVITKAFNVTKDATTGKYKSPITDVFTTITNETDGILALFINKKGFKKMVIDPVTGKKTWEKDSRTFIEREVDSLFEENPKRLVEVQYKGKIIKLNKEQYKEYLEDRRATEQNRGDVVHLGIEKGMARTKDSAGVAEGKFNKMVLDGAEAKLWSKTSFDWLEDAVTELKSRWNLSTLDTVHSEQIVFSDTLGIAGRADFLIRYEDGRIGIRDIKTSRSLREDFLSVNNLMKHGNTSFMDVENTRLNQAKLQVFLYAFISKVETPELQFKNLGVDWLASPQLFFGAESDIVLTNREIKAFLEMLDKFYKEQQTNNENRIYSQIDKDQRPDLWNVTNYTYALDDAKPIVNDIKEFDENEFETRLNKVKIAMFYDDDDDRYRKNASSYSDKGKALSKKREQMLKDIEWLYSQASNTNNYLKSYDKDLTLLNYYFSTSADTRNEIVHLYEKLRLKQMLAYKEEWLDNLATFDSLAAAALNSIRVKKGLSPITNKNNPMLGLGDWIKEYTDKHDYNELWGWAYKAIETKDNGVIQVMKTIEDLNNDSNLTEEQKNLGRYLNNYYESWFKNKDGKTAFMNETTSFTIDSNGIETGLSVLDVYNGKMESQATNPVNRTPFNWQSETEFEDINGNKVKGMWFPKVSMLDEEWNEKTGMKPYVSKEWWDRWWKKKFTMFYEEQERVTGEDQVAGLPLRYLGTPLQKNERNYSINLAQQFAQFGEHITRKKHMDVVYAWGKATVAYLEEEVRDSKTNKQKLEHVAKFIKKNIDSQLTNKSEEYDWFGRHIRFKGGVFSPKKLLIYIRRQGTLTLMVLNPINAFVNWLQTVNRSIIAGWSESVSHSKIAGATDDWIYPSVGNYTKTYKEYWGMNESLAEKGANAKRLKLYLLAQKFGFLPDNSEWMTSDTNIFARSSKWKNKVGSIAYFLTRVPEEANAMANLGAQLRQMKIKNKRNPEWDGKSFYDAYEVVEEVIPGTTTTRPVLKWMAGERGTRFENGKLEKIYELEAEEVMKLRNVYKTLQGGYRHDEKTILEMTILGELFLQFKKFLPSLFKLNLQTEAEDLGIGNFKEDENGIMQWHGVPTEGRWWTLARMAQTYSGIMITKAIPQKMSDMLNLKVGFDKQLRWSDMSDYQKYTVAESMITLCLWAPMALFLGKKAGSDNDDDSYLKLLKRINNNIAMPYAPIQMWEVFADARPVSIKLAARRISGYSQLAWSGMLIASGNESSAYTQKGDLKGLRESLQTTPVVSSAYQQYRFIEKKSMDLEDLITWSPR